MQQGKFIGNRQLLLFKNLSQQLVQHWMNVGVLYFKLNIQNIKINIYGETIGIKQFYKGVRMPCLIQHSAYQMQMSQNFKYVDGTTFRFLTSTMKKYNIFPEVGDVIFWGGNYWQIGIITSEQLIGGDSQTKWSYVCQTNILSQNKVKSLSIFNEHQYTTGRNSD